MQHSIKALNILTALCYQGIGRGWIYKYIASMDNEDTLVEQIKEKVKNPGEIISVEAFICKREEIKGKLLSMGDKIDGVIAYGEKGFPTPHGDDKARKESDTPVVLFYKGNLSLLSTKKYRPVAVVGLLAPNESVQKAEEMVVAELTQKEAIIVSGLANGCDQIAHEECLKQGGKTVAILPSTLSNILPKSNAQLAARIVEEGGLLLTEYYEEFKHKRELTSRYIERDRLQALFSSSIILAASYAANDKGLDSGSRHAMGKAFEYKIPRFVIYNESKHGDNPMYNLSRQLLREDKSVRAITSDNYKALTEEILGGVAQECKPMSNEVYSQRLMFDDTQDQTEEE